MDKKKGFIFEEQKQNIMSEIDFKRVYKGMVTSIRQAHLSPTGIRSYEIMFSGKKLYYNRSMKQEMIIVPGNIIRFYGNWQGNNDYFLIEDVLESYSPQQILLLNHFEYEKMKEENLADILSQQ